jgi:hypothetical protein
VASALAPRFVFWWLLLVVVQEAQRLFLVMAAARRGIPSAGVLGLTLFTGLRADLITASVGMLGALLVASLVATPVALRARRRAGAVLARTLGLVGGVLAVAYVTILTVDMGYYLYSGQRLDAVFMEYVADMIGQGRHGQLGGSQVGAETAAELGEVGTWAARLAGYATLLTTAILVWRVVFRRAVAPTLSAWPRATAVALCSSSSAPGVCTPMAPIRCRRRRSEARRSTRWRRVRSGS